MATRNGITPGNFLQLSPSKSPCDCPKTPQADAPHNHAIPDFPPRETSANPLQERQDILMAELLSRYSKLVSLFTAKDVQGATLENQASVSLQTEVETTALIKAVEDLHKLTRELKELWLAGPLRGIGEGEGEEDMAEDAKVVTRLVDELATKVQELHAGGNAQAV